MPAKREEPVLAALAQLRAQICEGAFHSEDRLTAAELSLRFGISPTPMREVLARLTGEGLLEDRPRQGFFVRRLTSGDLAQLYRLLLAQLRLTLEAAEPDTPLERLSSPGMPEDALSPILASEAHFTRWVARPSSRAFTGSFLRTQSLLARARRLEPELLDDLAPEWDGLLENPAPAAVLSGLRPYFARRLRLAPKLAERLDVAPPANDSRLPIGFE